MQVGDKVSVTGRPELGSGKIVRFYANQSTALIQLEDGTLKYFSYNHLVKT